MKKFALYAFLFVFAMAVAATLVTCVWLGGVEMKSMVAMLADEAKGWALSKVTIEKPVFVEELPVDVDDAIVDAAAEFDVPLAFMYAIAKNENYIHKNNDAKSTAGALGIMQIIPSWHVGPGKTCPWLSSWADLVGRKNIRNNVRCGAKYLRVLMDRSRAIKDNARFAKAVIGGYNKGSAYSENVLFAYLGEQIRR